MRPSPTVLTLSGLVAVLAVFTTAAGLFWPGTIPGPSTVDTVRGATVTLYAQGLYAHDSLLTGAGFRGTDVVILALGVPVLLLAMWAYVRQPLAGGLFLLSALSIFLYNGASLSFAAAHNPLFLLYVAEFGLSLFASFALVLASVDPAVLGQAVGEQVPRRSIANFLIIAGVILTFVWLSEIVAGLLVGEPPMSLAHYTTSVTHALDLGVITPILIVGGVLVHRRQGLGYLLAAPMLVLCTAIGIVVIAQTLAQLGAGVPLTAAQIAIFAASFTVMGAVATWLAVRLFRSISVPDATQAPA